MSAMYGMDSGAVEALAREIASAADLLDGIRMSTRSTLYTTPWHGADAAAFRSDWDSAHATRLVGTVNALRTAYTALLRNVGEQRTASQADDALAPCTVTYLDNAYEVGSVTFNAGDSQGVGAGPLSMDARDGYTVTTTTLSDGTVRVDVIFDREVTAKFDAADLAKLGRDQKLSLEVAAGVLTGMKVSYLINDGNLSTNLAEAQKISDFAMSRTTRPSNILWGDVDPSEILGAHEIGRQPSAIEFQGVGVTAGTSASADMVPGIPGGVEASVEYRPSTRYDWGAGTVVQSYHAELAGQFDLIDPGALSAAEAVEVSVTRGFDGQLRSVEVTYTGHTEASNEAVLGQLTGRADNIAFGPVLAQDASSVTGQDVQRAYTFDLSDPATRKVFERAIDTGDLNQVRHVALSNPALADQEQRVYRTNVQGDSVGSDLVKLHYESSSGDSTLSGLSRLPAGASEWTTVK